VRGGVGCLALRKASEPARGATYPTRGSKLTERTPKRQGAGGESDVGRGSATTRETTTCRECGVSLSVLLYTPDSIDRVWKTLYLNLAFGSVETDVEAKFAFSFRGFTIKLKSFTRAVSTRSHLDSFILTLSWKKILETHLIFF